MSLPLLYSPPNDPESWSAWSFNHAANHYGWVHSIFIQKQVNLTQYLLDPVDPQNLGMWLYEHQAAHDQANAALGTSGNNLLGLDWEDPDQFAMWLRLNGDEHVRISAALGIG